MRLELFPMAHAASHRRASCQSHCERQHGQALMNLSSTRMRRASSECAVRVCRKDLEPMAIVTSRTRKCLTSAGGPWLIVLPMLVAIVASPTAARLSGAQANAASDGGQGPPRDTASPASSDQAVSTKDVPAPQLVKDIHPGQQWSTKRRTHSSRRHCGGPKETRALPLACSGCRGRRSTSGSRGGECRTNTAKPPNRSPASL